VGDLFDGFQVKDEEEEKRAAKKAEDDKKTTKKKIVEIDAFDQVTLNVQADVEKLSDACITKIGKGAAAAKGGSVSFMRELLKQVADQAQPLSSWLSSCSVDLATASAQFAAA